MKELSKFVKISALEYSLIRNLREGSLMMDEIAILSVSEKIETAFKSMIKSGRPDVTDEQNNSLIPNVYVDLYENNYVLRQVIDDNHTLLKGRKGTGKSTIFLQNKNYYRVEIKFVSISIYNRFMKKSAQLIPMQAGTYWSNTKLIAISLQR